MKDVLSGTAPALSGERKRITVMFGDLRDFTSMAETMGPEDVLRVLEAFFEAMVEVVQRNQGYIDKFMGDGLMVLFGALHDDPWQGEHAVKAAIEMQQKLRQVSEKLQSERFQPLRMGIGINSGLAVVGNIGSKSHFEFTALGNTVNVAARLESATKDHHVDILISEHTYDEVKPSFQVAKAGPIQVKGLTEPITAYSVEDTGAPAPSPTPE